MTKQTTRTIGNYRLAEKEFHGDTICTVYVGRAKSGVYCSIADALRHAGEWMDPATYAQEFGVAAQVSTKTVEINSKFKSVKEMFTAIDQHK